MWSWWKRSGSVCPSISSRIGFSFTRVGNGNPIAKIVASRNSTEIAVRCRWIYVHEDDGFQLGSTM